MSNEKNMQRKWDREEVIILVTEYYKNRNLSAAKIDESYHRISKFLRQREELCTGKSVSDMFRNYAGIRMQSARIRCLDSESNLHGMQGTRLQKEIVKEFLQDPALMYAEAETIYKKYSREQIYLSENSKVFDKLKGQLYDRKLI